MAKNLKAETSRLILREIVPTDADDLFEMDSDPEVHRYIHNKPLTDIKDVYAIIEMLQKQYTENGIGRWAVEEKSTGECLGWCGLKYFTENINGRSGFYELGYRFKRKHWGRGLATESSAAVLDYGFRHFHIDAIYALTATGNTASKNVLGKLGFHQVEAFNYDGEPVDWHELPAREWMKKSGLPQHKQAALKTFDSYAAQYADKFQDVSAYSGPLNVFCELVGDGGMVLDIGCGPGNLSRYVLENRRDLRIHGIDIAPNMIALAASANPKATFEVMDAGQISGLGTKFNGIICGFCLPYLSKDEALKLISDAAMLLYPGGVLYLSTMEGDYATSGIVRSSSGDSETYTHYHEAGYLTAALHASGFDITALSRQPFLRNGRQEATDLIVVAVKK